MKHHDGNNRVTFIWLQNYNKVHFHWLQKKVCIVSKLTKFLDVFENWSSSNFCKYHRKTPALESIVDKTKKPSSAGVFIWNLRNFDEHLWRKPPVAASVYTYSNLRNVT